MTTALVTRPASEVSTVRHDPTDDWHPEARKLRAHLEDIYGAGDPLPLLAGGWVTRQRSRHTRTAYARQFRYWEAYVRSTGGHPLEVRMPLADAYASRLQTAPTLRRVKGGRRGEMAADGKPAGARSRAQALTACSSFYRYAKALGVVQANPFSAVQRPRINADYSPTDGLMPAETDKLLATARAWAPRSYALVSLLYLLGLRVDELLKLDASQLGYDTGHHVLPIKRKGYDDPQKVPVPPAALDALLTYLDGRRDGPLFATRSGTRWTEPQVWAHLRVLARHAGIPQASVIHPHTLRHCMITDGLEAGVKLEVMQDAAGHRDPRTTQRYNRRRGLLDNHPAYLLSAKMAERMA